MERAMLWLCTDTRGRLQEDIDGIKIDFIDMENLVKNKLATGRLQDLADVEKLRQ